MNKSIFVFTVIFVFFILLTNSVFGMKLLSPLEQTYQNNQISSDGRLRLRLDYINDEINDTWIEIDNKKIDVRKDLVIQYFKNDSETVEMSTKSDKINNISNYMEYEFNVLMTGSGTAYFNLTNDENVSKISIKYNFQTRKGTWQCYNNRTYKNLIDSKNDINYKIKLKVFNDGQKYTNYTVLINGNENTCLINSNKTDITQINKIIKKVEDTSAIISHQILKSGTYYLDLSPGKHKITLYGKENDIVENISNNFYVVLSGCGDLICNENDTFKTCPVDCKKFVCKDDSFKGDTNNDGIINKKDLDNVLNIISERIPKPKKDCCIDINDDGVINTIDYNEIKEIISGNKLYERCDNRCNDGTNDGMCSITKKPLFCDYGTFKSKCSECGCDEGYSCMDDETCFKLEQCKCSDVASNPEDSLGYDNVINLFDQYALEDKIKMNDSYDKKFDLNSDGKIDNKDLKCVEYNFGKTTTCSGPAHCEDGTKSGECSLTKPKYCSNIKLEIVEDCRICGCIPYDSCELNGKCKRHDNFKIIISNQTNTSKQYMQDGTIFTPVTQGENMRIAFGINPIRNLENVTIKINLKDGNRSLKGIDEINKRYSNPNNLTKNKIKEIVLSLKTDDNEKIGIYYGELLILINGYEFSKIPLEVELKNKITEEMLKNNESNWEKIKKRWPYILAILLVFGVLIFLIRKRNKEREYIKFLERKHNLILR